MVLLEVTFPLAPPPITLKLSIQHENLDALDLWCPRKDLNLRHAV